MPMSPQSARYFLNLAGYRQQQLRESLHDAAKQSDTVALREWKAELVVCGRAIDELTEQELAR